MSSIQSNFMASNSLPTNSKNEDPNPDHDPFRLSLGKRVLHGTNNKRKHSAVLLKGRDSIESTPYVGREFREPDSNDHIFSSSQYDHPQIMYAPFDRVLFTSVPFDRVLFTSVHRSVDTKRNVCHTPSMKTAISHSKVIKQKKITER